MINNIYNLLRLIYLNRFRRLSYSDKSRFYILLGIFIIAYFQLWIKDWEYKNIIVIILIFSNSITLLQRNDYIFFRKQLGLFYSHTLIFTDILVWNVPLLVYLLVNNLLLFIASILFFFLLPFILNLRKINVGNLKIFSVKDPIWNTHIRTRPWEYLILVFSLFLQYQGLKYNNEGLYTFGLYIISLMILQIYRENEKIYFYKFSKRDKKSLLISLFRCNVFNYICLFAPSILMLIFFFRMSLVEVILGAIISIIPLFWIRYLFFKDALLKILVAYLYIIFIYGINISISFITNIFVAIGINLILYFLSQKKFNKLSS